MLPAGYIDKSNRTDLIDRRFRTHNPRPFHHPSTYSRQVAKLTYNAPGMPQSASMSRGSSAAALVSLIPANVKASVHNKALSKIYAQANQAEDLMVAMIERQKSVDLVVKSVKLLSGTLSAVRKRDPRILRQTLGFYGRQTGIKDLVKTPAGLWLAYNFGVVPTMHDLHSACQVFTKSLPPFKMQSSSMAHCLVDYGKLHGEADYLEKLGGTVTAFDANRQLATSLGFDSPISTAWELTPWSWAVDYFANVNQLITNLEPRFPALTISDMYTTQFASGFVAYRERDTMYSGYDVFNIERRQGSWGGYQLELHKPSDLSTRHASYLTAGLATQVGKLKH